MEQTRPNPPRRKDSAIQRRNRVALLFLSLLTAGCALCGAPALAATPLSITAANLTMPAYDPPTISGGVTSIHLGSSQFTVTGIPAEGTLTVTCQYSGPVTPAIMPQQCGVVGPGLASLQAGETTAGGTVYFVPYGDGPVPSLAHLRTVPRPSSRLPATALALAGALMLGFGFRRRTRRALSLALLAACALAGAPGISACGAGNSNTMTPGTYPYTLSAAFTATGSDAIQNAATTITLTVQQESPGTALPCFLFQDSLSGHPTLVALESALIKAAEATESNERQGGRDYCAAGFVFTGPHSESTAF
jgi:hypothetical protein